MGVEDGLPASRQLRLGAERRRLEVVGAPCGWSTAHQGWPPVLPACPAHRRNNPHYCRQLQCGVAAQCIRAPSRPTL